MRPRALVVGGDGRIARALIPALARDGYEVVATSRRKAGALALDLEEVARSGSVALPACDVAFVCAALPSYAACRRDEAAARAINADAPAVLAHALRTQGAHLVLLSTNGVFDGRVPFRPASDAPDGATAYGRSKADAEARVRAIDASAAVLRLTRVFCPGEPLLAGWAGALRRHAHVSAFSDMVAAPVASDHVVAALLAIARQRCTGVLQLSACREVTYVEIARHIATRVGAPPELVDPEPAASRGIAPGEAPRHASLECTADLARYGIAPIEPLDVVDAVLGLAR